jgi:hypothetical protein
MSGTMNTMHVAETRVVTPEWASTTLANDLFSRQRAKSSQHVLFLAETMARGEFDGGSALRFGQLSGRQFLIDGQHRLNAVIEYGEPVEFVVITTRCSTADELARLYARIDRGRGRSISDALKALGTFENTDLSATNIQTVLACAPLFAGNLTARRVTGSSYASKSAEGRATIMEPWLPAAAEFFRAISGAQSDISKSMHRREVIACGIAIMADAPKKMAEEFWSGIAADDGLSKEDPRKQALEFIRRTKSTQSGIGHLAHGTAVCWNAWARGDTMKLVKVADPSAPLRLQHTRFTGRQA